MSRVEEQLVESYKKNGDIEILIYVTEHKSHFTSDMVKWAKEELRRLAK